MENLQSLIDQYESLSKEEQGRFSNFIVAGKSAGNSMGTRLIISQIGKRLADFKQVIKRVDQNIFECKVGVHMLSIGEHIVHVTDFFRVLTSRPKSNYINLNADRGMNNVNFDSKESVEGYLTKTMNELEKMNDEDMDQEIIFLDVIDGKPIEIKTTLGSALYDSYSHAQHHFVTIGDIVKSEMAKTVT